MTVNKYVLIADDDPSITDALARRCKALGLDTRVAVSGAETLACIAAEPPDLLILDVNMPAADGITVLERLLADTDVPFIPVIFLSGRSDPQTISRCESLGAHYVIKGTGVWQKLKPIVCEVMKLPYGDGTESARVEAPRESLSVARPPTVLAVDDDTDMLVVLKVRLEAMGLRFLGAHYAIQAYWMALKETPDLIITDYMMPQGSGKYFLGLLKGAQASRNIPVIILTGAKLDSGDRDRELAHVLLEDFGAAAYLEKPLDMEELKAELGKHIDIPGQPSSPPREQSTMGRLRLLPVK